MADLPIDYAPIMRVVDDGAVEFNGEWMCAPELESCDGFRVKLDPIIDADDEIIVGFGVYTMFGDTWKHPALKPYNGKEVTVEPKLNEEHQTELTVKDGEKVVCVIGRG